MALLIKQFCRVNHLIFVETGCREGQEVYWFKGLDGQRFCLAAQEIASRLDRR